MPTVHDIGSKHYLHRMQYPSRKFPLAERGFSQEIDFPYRSGECVVVRLPLTRQALVLGTWGEPHDETDALTAAIGARRMEADEDVW